MGRGRAKAKQTKVARALKYDAHEPDFESLRAELTGGSRPAAEPAELDEAAETEDYEEYLEDEDDEDADED